MLAEHQEVAFDSTMNNIDAVAAVDPALRSQGNIYSGIPRGWFPVLTPELYDTVRRTRKTVSKIQVSS